MSAAAQTEANPWAGGHVTQWFVALTGIIYATGFLAVATFADYLGEREAISEFFRTKYIHVGLLCVALPVVPKKMFPRKLIRSMGNFGLDISLIG